MEPPICKICGRNFIAEYQQGDGGLLKFKEYEDQEPLGKHETGHPDNEAWFCSDHIDEASDLTHLTLSEAMKKLEE